MAITVPQPTWVISATDFGIPVANQLNALAPTAWTGVTFQNGWANFDGARTVRYRKIGDLVYLQGVAAGGTLGYGVPMFVLPAGFRPRADTAFPALMAGTNALGQITVQSNGNVSAVSLLGAGTNAFVYMDGMTFQAVN